jgi:hypothetical protein
MSINKYTKDYIVENKCDDCLRIFYTKEQFENHKNKCDKIKYLFVCNDCKLSFKYKEKLEDHKRWCDKIERPILCKWNDCYYTNDIKGILYMHENMYCSCKNNGEKIKKENLKEKYESESEEYEEEREENNLMENYEKLKEKLQIVNSILSTEQKIELEDKIKKANLNNKSIQKIIPRSLRDRLWRNNFDNNPDGKCYVCEGSITYINFHAGHVISIKNGGDHNIHNLRVICQSCNSSMNSQNLEEFKKIYFE